MTDSSQSFRYLTPQKQPCAHHVEPVPARIALDIMSGSVKDYIVSEYLTDKLLFEEGFFQRHMPSHRVLGKEDTQTLVALLEQANQILAQNSS